jgi:hypothetical protein
MAGSWLVHGENGVPVRRRDEALEPAELSWRSWSWAVSYMMHIVQMGIFITPMEL